MIRSKVISHIKKDIKNPSNGRANASASYAAFDAIKVTTSSLELKSIEDTEYSKNLARRSLPRKWELD